MAAQLICGLSLLVFVHELGHYLAARYFGMRIDKFFIFFDAFGTKLWSKKIGDCEYGIGWLPLGGYVKIAGMIDESMDKEAMKGEPEEWEFRSKPAWQRFIVMIGGIVMNLLIGVIIFAGYLGYFEKDYIAVDDLKDGIYAFEMAEEMGFETGDKLVAVDGETPIRLKDFKGPAVLFGSTITVERDGKQIDIEVPESSYRRGGENFFAPYKHDVVVGALPDSSGATLCGLQKEDVIKKVATRELNNFGDLQSILQANKESTISVEVLRDGKTERMSCKVDSIGRLGFNPFFDYKTPNKMTAYTAGETVKYGVKQGWEAMYYNALGIGKMFTGEIDPVESMQSPIGIAKNIYGGTWEWGRFWYITGLLSFILAFMNILPIPALDGGHMVFLGVEMLRGKPLSDKFLERAQVLGMLILLPLMLLVIGKDIYQIVAEWLGFIMF